MSFHILGPYQILGALGSGGMGEVFRARDTRLNRDVAIKMLPRDLASDPDRLHRFEQESQRLAALNHPNILTIHDAGVQEGAPYLVSELLEGKTLREELKGGALPLRKATDYALQITQGLAAAHSKGIIHRDIKPENIFITKDGRVKILDFGLAKLKSDLKSHILDSKSGGDPDAPTLADSTQPGMVLGTPAYMSPEQVRGEPTDHRSDIFALGCVLYEMLSGIRAFRRDTLVESMNAILNQEPADLSADMPHPSPALGRIVLRCLEKQPENRFQTSKDLGFAVENAGMLSSSILRIQESKQPSSRLSLARLVPWGLAGVCLIGLMATFLSHRGSARSPSEASRAIVLRKFDLDLPAPTRKTPASEVYLSISPDGKKFAYVNGDGLWVRRLDTIAPPVLLAAGERITAPFWSPQSIEVGYFEGRHLNRIAAMGGTAPILIGTTPEQIPYSLPGAAWLGDRIVFTTGVSGLLEVPALGGSVTTILPPAQGERDFHHASALPDGRGVLFVVHRPSGPDTIAVWSARGQRKVLLHIPGGSLRTPVFSPTSHVLFHRLDQGRGLWAFPFSLETLERTGEPFRVSEMGSSPSLANDGTLLLSLTDTELYAPRQLAWVDRSGKLSGTLGSPLRGLSQPRVSPEGRRVAAIAGESTTDLDIWLFEVAGGAATQLTRNDQPDIQPCWWNSGQTVVYTRRTGAGSQVMVKPTDGPGAEQQLIEGDGAISGSGKYLILWQNAAMGQPTLKYVRLMEKPLKPVVFPESFQSVRGCALSPDDQRLAYVAVEADILQVYLVNFPGFTNRWKVSRAGGHEIRWNPNGQELLYLSTDSRALMSARLKPDGSGADGPTKLCDLPDSISTFPNDYDVAPGGDRLLMLQKVPEPAGGVAARLNIRVVLNWFEEFRKTQ